MFLFDEPQTVAADPVKPHSAAWPRASRFPGRIHAIEVTDADCGLHPDELERRLIELGFVEGASVEILHEGFFGHDPIAVRVNHATIALRRREAMAILVT